MVAFRNVLYAPMIASFILKVKQKGILCAIQIVLAICFVFGYNVLCCRRVAQPGRALRSGRRGRQFESDPSDHLKQAVKNDGFFF